MNFELTDVQSMKIAIATWNERVSPVMDSARNLMVVTYDEGAEVSREKLVLPQVEICNRAGFIADLGVQVLICGAISRQYEMLLERSGIQVAAWFRGDVDALIAAIPRGELKQARFILPGCGQQRIRRRNRFGQNRRA
jgi:predicted Fe-Mo cluster-binding NifX family protein